MLEPRKRQERPVVVGYRTKCVLDVGLELRRVSDQLLERWLKVHIFDALQTTHWVSARRRIYVRIVVIPRANPTDAGIRAIGLRVRWKTQAHNHSARDKPGASQRSRS